MTTSRMPNFYRPGIGTSGPLRWQDDKTGILPTAVLAFFEARATELQLGLVREYVEYYINAPCWQQGDTKELDQLREKVQTLKTSNDLNNFIHECLEIGLDPL